jgi:VWFA-related protein
MLSMAWMPTLLLLVLLAQDRPAFRSDVALVHVDAEVRENGRVITDLGKESFAVTDQGRPQPIVYFGHDEVPLDVVLVFDGRRQVRPDLKRVTEAAHTALSDLREGDRIAVMAFGVTANDCRNEVISPLTADFAAAERSLGVQALKEGPKYSGFCSIQAGLSRRRATPARFSRRESTACHRGDH